MEPLAQHMPSARSASTSHVLTVAARIAAHHPAVMAPALATYQHAYGLDEASLAQRLGCCLVALRQLALCRRPLPEAPTFAADVQQLAAYIGCNAASLMALLRGEPFPVPTSNDNPPRSRPSWLLAHGARLAEQYPHALAQTLRTYREQHRLTEVDLAQQLGCTVRALQSLALCRRPVPDTPTFAADVHQLAAYIGCDAGQLEAVLRGVTHQPENRS